jgi:hypothetical protein
MMVAALVVLGGTIWPGLAFAGSNVSSAWCDSAGCGNGPVHGGVFYVFVVVDKGDDQHHVRADGESAVSRDFMIVLRLR